MFCSKCGAEIRDVSQYCPACGAPVVRRAPEPQKSHFYSEADKFSRKIVPNALLVKFPQVSAVVFACGYVVIIFILVGVIAFAVDGIHDLSGTYTASGAFPVTRIIFKTDGTFTAYCDYYEYNTGDTYYGKYSKHGQKYDLWFTGGKSNGGNSVTQFNAKTIGSGFSLTAEKMKNGSLKIYVIPKIGFSNWAGSYKYFYRK